MNLSKIPTAQIGELLTPARVALPGGYVPKRARDVLTATPSVGSTPNKGSYAEMIAALSDDCYGLLVEFIDGQVGNRDFLWDIAVGAAGSEAILIADLHRSAGNTVVWSTACLLPIFIPRGTRVAVRAAASASGLTAYITARAMLLDSLFAPPRLRRSETWGTVAATTRLTSIDPGGSANTKGSWTQLVASTTRRVRSVVVQTGNQRNTNRTACTWKIDLGVGGAGSEAVVVPDMYCNDVAVQHGGYPEHFGPFAVDIPAGSRVSARAACTITDATDRLIDVSAIGFSE